MVNEPLFAITTSPPPLAGPKLGPPLVAVSVPTAVLSGVLCDPMPEMAETVSADPEIVAPDVFTLPPYEFSVTAPPALMPDEATLMLPLELNVKYPPEVPESAPTELNPFTKLTLPVVAVAESEAAWINAVEAVDCEIFPPVEFKTNPPLNPEM
jgi:hypothetical protein